MSTKGQNFYYKIFILPPLEICRAARWRHSLDRTI